MTDLKKFIDESLELFERIAARRKDNWTQDKLVSIKSEVGNRLTYMTLLRFPGRQEEIECYLVEKGYSPYESRRKESEKRLLKTASLEQDPKQN